MTARLSDLHDVTDLAKAVGVFADRISQYVGAAQQSNYYRVMQIPKRHRRRRAQFRTVHKSTFDWLTQVHRMIAVLVGRQTTYPDHVQGFVDRRSIFTNAARHLAPRVILHGDIAGFFDAITTEHVRRGFISLGCSSSMAELFARASTIDGALRQGTRCAPALANLVCRQLDVELLTLAESLGSRYTRYADDLTFSGDEVPSCAQVAAVLTQHGFALRDGRCHFQVRGRGQFVTGLSVSDPAQPRLSRRLKKRIRLVLYYVEKYGAENHFEYTGSDYPVGGTAWLKGMLDFFHSIEPRFAPRLQSIFRSRHEGSTNSR